MLNYSYTNIAIGNLENGCLRDLYLGNTRVTYRAVEDPYTHDLTKQIEYAADYMPYGKLLRHYEGPQGQEKYLLTGKERDEETQLDRYDHRSYDSDIARWISPDPLSVMAPDWSPYRFNFDNPIIFVDPNGLFETRKEAREYRKEHGISGKIRKDTDGDGFMISGKSTTYTKASSWEASNGFANEHGVVESAKGIGNTNNLANSGSNGLTPAQMSFNAVATGIVLAEPTPFGEAVLGLINLGFLIYNNPPTFEMSRYKAEDADKPSHERMGRIKGEAPRNNKDQNKQFNQLSKQYGLTYNQRETLHRAISGKGYNYQKIEQTIRQLFNK